MYGKGLAKGLGISFVHNFEKKQTQEYPEERPHLQPRFRGCLQFDGSKCIACGMCVRSCPNGVLKLETTKDRETKKKRYATYTIDIQYCMFCNYCVEACPAHCLSFNHDFELAKYRRSDLAIHYVSELGPGDPVDDKDSAGDDAAKAKKIKAMETALSKSPDKVLGKLLNDETKVKILSEVLAADQGKASKLAALLVEDKEKAGKVAVAMVNKELKNREKA